MKTRDRDQSAHRPGGKAVGQKVAAHLLHSNVGLRPRSNKRCFLNGVFQFGVFRGWPGSGRPERSKMLDKSGVFTHFRAPLKGAPSVTGRSQESEKQPRLEPLGQGVSLPFLDAFEACDIFNFPAEELKKKKKKLKTQEGWLEGFSFSSRFRRCWKILPRYSSNKKCYPCQGLGTFWQRKWLLENCPPPP